MASLRVMPNALFAWANRDQTLATVSGIVSLDDRFTGPS
jgi:hypothetical protein